MDDPDPLDRARRLLADADRLRTTLEAERRAAVDTWRPASADPEPHAAEVHHRPADGVRHGVDAAGRLVLTEEPTATPGRADASVWLHGADVVERVAWDASGSTRFAAVYTLVGKDVDRIDTVWAADGSTRTQRYLRREGRVHRIELSGVDSTGEPWRDARDLEHDDAGVARVWWVEPGGQRSLVYERVTGRLDGALDTLRLGLGALVRAAVARSGCPEPVGALALWTHAGAAETRLPPRVGLVPAAELVGLGPDRWRPARWSRSLRPLPDSELAALLASVNAEIWQADRHADVSRLLEDVARDLAEDPGLLRAGAFACWATTAECADPEAELLRQLSPSDRATLDDAGLV